MLSKMSLSMNTEKILILAYVPPRWDPVRELFVIDFKGRVTLSSVKNCQISYTPEGIN